MSPTVGGCRPESGSAGSLFGSLRHPAWPGGKESWRSGFTPTASARVAVVGFPPGSTKKPQVKGPIYPLWLLAGSLPGVFCLAPPESNDPTGVPPGKLRCRIEPFIRSSGAAARQRVDINVTPIGPRLRRARGITLLPGKCGERRAPGPPRADHRSTVRVVADHSADRARRARDPGQAGPLVTRGQCRSTTRALPHATETAQPADED